MPENLTSKKCVLEIRHDPTGDKPWSLNIVRDDGSLFPVLQSSAEYTFRSAHAPQPSALLSHMVDRFLAWPLPKSVCSDTCVTDSNYPSPRSGTNLLTADEARSMLEYVTRAAHEPAPALTDRVPHDIAVKILRVRDLLVEKDYDEAYHVLYSIADPSYTSFTPWAELERTAEPPSDALREAVQILEDGKELGSVFHLRGAIIQALMKLHEQHPDAWPSPTKEAPPIAPATACFECRGSGQICTGNSGQEVDGYAPILERCEACDGTGVAGETGDGR